MADPADTSRDLVEKGSSTSADTPVEHANPDGDSYVHSSVHGKDEKPSNSLGKEGALKAGEQEVGGSHDDPPAEPPSEQPLQRVTTAPGEDYSVLTVTQKKLIVMTASFASLFSPMATAIYCKYPSFQDD